MFARSLRLIAIALLGAAAAAQDTKPSFEQAVAEARRLLDDETAQLNALREQILAEQRELDEPLAEREMELAEVRAEFQEQNGILSNRSLFLTNLRPKIEKRRGQAQYMADLLGDYVRKFDSRLMVAERQRYQEALERTLLAPESSDMTESEVYRTQLDLIDLAFDRLDDAMGGTSFPGKAVDPSGFVDEGTFVMIGPVAVFRSADGVDVGPAEQRIGSQQARIISFYDPLDTEAAERVLQTNQGTLPLDPTLGSAHQTAMTQKTLLDEIEDGGTVMYAILALAGSALLVALLKWLSMLFIRKPSRKRVSALLASVEEGDEESAQDHVRRMRGPVGRMLASGVAHIREPRELIEEVMYEHILTTRLRLQRFLPFIAISAASAPLLGLLGTVTGIISTFETIQIVGTGDVKMLSGGISEALITTKFGLIVAIPSLLIHAFLSRKARGVVGQMEIAGAAFVNQVSKSPFEQRAVASTRDELIPAPDPRAVREQVQEILTEMLGMQSAEELTRELAQGNSQPA